MAANYGAGVSRYLDPTNHNFDLTLFQQSKPVFDSELNLTQDIRQDRLRTSLQTSTPSGFLTGDFLSPNRDDYTFGLIANSFILANKPIVQVNGWIFPVEYTNTPNPGENLLTLAAPPAGATDVGADFVFLEVWRALVAPSPSTANKPAPNALYFNGNVLADPSTNLPDDLIDPVFTAESTQRVQIQYAIRSVRMATRQDRLGYTDSNVFAFGPSGVISTSPYSPEAQDSGLWRAGTGVGGDLGTVDGYVYSIPISIVFRRNTAPWNFLSNGNGGSLIVSGVSDRPDGLYGDQIAASDILDMRHAVSLSGIDAHQILDLNASLLMDQNLRQSVTDTAQTGWVAAGANVGNTFLKADDFVPSTPVVDPPSGNTVRSVDGICQVFTDRPHIQRYTLVVPAPGLGWTSGDLVTLDLTALSPLGAPLADEMPLGTVIRDVENVFLNDSNGLQGYLLFPTQLIAGLSTQTVTLSLGTSPVPGSSQDVWVDFILEYPAGSGLSSHITETVSNFDVVIHAPSNLNAAIGSVFPDNATGQAAIRAFLFTQFEAPHRELQFYFTTAAAVSLQVRALNDTTIVLPEMVHNGVAGIVSVVDSLAVPHLVSMMDITQRFIFLDGLDPLPNPDDLVTVTYFPARAMPVTATPLTIYYRTNALQAVPFEYLPTTLSVLPLHISRDLYVATASSGSTITPYPYESPTNQLPNHASTPNWNGEDDLRSPADVSIDDFSANAGMLQLPSLIPFAPGSLWTFDNPVNVTVQDQEFIDHYASSPLNAYKPSVASQGLSANADHKVFTFVLARLTADTLFARAGEVVLLGLSQILQDSKQNRAAMSDNPLEGAAACAVYRVKGSWLLP